MAEAAFRKFASAFEHRADAGLRPVVEPGSRPARASLLWSGCGNGAVGFALDCAGRGRFLVRRRTLRVLRHVR